MQHFNLKFIRKSQLAFAVLVLAILALGWIQTARVKGYEYSVERATRANHVLQSNLQLSNLVFEQLHAMDERVLSGASKAVTEAGTDASSMREAVSIMRQGIEYDVFFPGISDASAKLGRVHEIETLVEEFIQTRELVEQALSEGRAEDALDELERLENSGFRDSFNSLILAAMADQSIEPSSEEYEVMGLSQSIVNTAPILLTSLVVIAFLLNLKWSRHAADSVRELHEGALAYKKGDLSHRIPRLSDSEFQSLGRTFNAMAVQLSEQREQLRDTNLQLEEMVEERTRQLQETNRKLAIADSNRRKLLANISHEFRTPLTVIRGEAEIALRGFSKNNDGHRESFRRIVDQAVNATRLVDDLLFIARVDAGEPRFKASSVAISSMVDSVCQELNANAGRKRIKIEQLEMAPGAIVQGDERRLRQVFTIILDNAIKYSNPDGLIKIQVLQRKRSVEVMIKDQGIGLEEGEAEMAFERFYRAPAATDKAAGTGLGLPVAKAIVEAHNGTISLEGKPGEGVTATVVLPFGREFGIVT